MDDFIPALVRFLTEAGVNTLNPWQVSCKGMDDTAKFMWTGVLVLRRHAPEAGLAPGR